MNLKAVSLLMLSALVYGTNCEWGFPVMLQVGYVTVNIKLSCCALSYFLPRCMECRRGLAMRILSVCPSVCRTRALRQNGRKLCLYCYIILKNIYPSFLRRRILVGDDPICREFWVNRPPLERNRSALAVTPSEKILINTNRKSTMRFPIRWSS